MILADAHRDETDLYFPSLERITVISKMIIKSAARHIDVLAVFGSITVYQRGRSRGCIRPAGGPVDPAQPRATAQPRAAQSCVRRWHCRRCRVGGD